MFLDIFKIAINKILNNYDVSNSDNFLYSDPFHIIYYYEYTTPFTKYYTHRENIKNFILRVKPLINEIDFNVIKYIFENKYLKYTYIIFHTIQSILNKYRSI